MGNKDVRDHDKLHVSHLLIVKESPLDYQLFLVKVTVCFGDFFIQLVLQFVYLLFRQEVLQLDESIRGNCRRVGASSIFTAGELCSGGKFIADENIETDYSCSCCALYAVSFRRRSIDIEWSSDSTFESEQSLPKVNTWSLTTKSEATYGCSCRFSPTAGS